MTALVTPLRGGQIDEEALRRLISWQIESGIDALVPCGTTGESVALSAEEQKRVIRITVEETRGRVPVIAGAGANSTEHAIALSKTAKEAGADGLLQVTPYYNRPPQEGLFQHFRAIVNEVRLPTVVYNVPARTGCDLQVDTVARLCELEGIVGIKEASGTVQRTQAILARVGDRLTVFSGEDAINFPLYAVGAKGCISVVSNIAPKLIADCWDRAFAGDMAGARKLHAESLPLADALFMEPSPIPTKTALSLMGKMTAELRLPMVPMSDKGCEHLTSVLKKSGLLS